MTCCHMLMGPAGRSSLSLPGAELGAGKAGGRPTPARLWFLSLVRGEREIPNPGCKLGSDLKGSSCSFRQRRCIILKRSFFRAAQRSQLWQKPNREGN